MAKGVDPVGKIRAYSRAMLRRYVAADRKLAMLKPIAYDQDLIARWDKSVGALGVTVLQETLFLDLVGDARAFTLDLDNRAASLRNVMQMLADDDLRAAVRDAFCAPPPKEWVGPPMTEEMAQIRQTLDRKAQQQKSADFDRRYAELVKGAGALVQHKLSNKIDRARHRLVGHFGMTKDRTDEEPRAVTPQDVGLKWGDIEKFFEMAEPLIAETDLLVSNTTWAMEQSKAIHERVAKDFWDKAC